MTSVARGDGERSPQILAALMAGEPDLRMRVAGAQQNVGCELPTAQARDRP